MRGCRSSAALCVIIASMSIVRHDMPVVLFGGIFATVPLFGIVMRYTIPPLFFVNYVGIVSRHRLCRSTNSYVPRCLVRVISVSAFPFFRQLSRMVCGVVDRLLRYASASRLCQLSGMLCRLFCSVASLPPFPFWGWLCGIPYRLFSSLVTSGLYPDIGFSELPIVTCHGVLCALSPLARFPSFVSCPAWYAGCRSSAALCVSIASMSIVRHNMPVVLFGGIFATVPLLGVVMRYTIPPLFFVNYVGIVFRHRLFRATNSYVPRCLVRAISVSADYSIFIRCSLFCDTLRNSPLSRPRDERAMTER